MNRGLVASWLPILFARTFGIYRAHLRMIVAVAAGVAAVVELILGLGLGQLTAGYRASSPIGEQAVEFAASAFVTTPLVTAMLARAVLDVVSGEQPSARRAIRCGLDLFAPLLIAMVLFVVALAAGFFALIIPGIYILVSWYFVAQAVVVDDRRGLAALARSGELVRGHWPAAALVGLAFQLAILIPGMVVSTAFDAAARGLDAAAVLVIGGIFVQAFSLPFVAIGATLFYLDLRADAVPGGAGRPAA